MYFCIQPGAIYVNLGLYLCGVLLDSAMITMLYLSPSHTVKPVKNGHSRKEQKLFFKANYRLMQVKSIADCSKGEHSTILSTYIELPIFVLSIFELPF